MDTRWCGECGSEYVAGYAVCSDCGIALIDMAPSFAMLASGIRAATRHEHTAGFEAEDRQMLSWLLDGKSISYTWDDGTLVASADHDEEVDELIAFVSASLADTAPNFDVGSDGVLSQELMPTSASHPRRIAASMIDGLVFGMARVLIFSATQGFTGFVMSTVVGIAYETVSVARYQRGFGKAIMGLSVVDVHTGDNVSWLRAFLRPVVSSVYVVTAFASAAVASASWIAWSLVVYLPILINIDRRGLHDFAARSQVIMLTVGRDE